MSVGIIWELTHTHTCLLISSSGKMDCYALAKGRKERKERNAIDSFEQRFLWPLIINKYYNILY